jgi:hypothetical protein
VLLHPVYRYILVYPQGCDVCNHLSLFLCVADYDKLLPGDQQGPAAALQWALQPSSGAGAHDQATCCNAPLTGSYLHSMVLLQTIHLVLQLNMMLSCSCRLESLCTVHHCCCQQGPQEEQVLRCITVVEACVCASFSCAGGVRQSHQHI